MKMVSSANQFKLARKTTKRKKAICERDSLVQALIITQQFLK